MTEDQVALESREVATGPAPLRAVTTPTVLVDSPAIWGAIRNDLASATGNAWIQTYSFEGDSVGEALANALRVSPARDRRLLVDSYTRVNQSDRWLFTPRALADSDARAEARNTKRLARELRRGGVGVKWGRPFGFAGRRFFNRDHKKLVLVDDRVVYLGGVNFSEHNFAWHDVMIRWEDEALAQYLRRDFESSWGGESHGEVRTFPRLGVEVHLLAGRGNRRAMKPILDLIATASESVDVISPYLGPPFTDHLSAAARRGVRVRVVTPRENNKGYLQRYLLAEAGRLGIQVHLYEKGMVHMKFMLIDGRILVGGSSNFDLMSYNGFLAENIAVIRNPGVVEDFRALVLEPDLAASTPCESETGGSGPVGVLGRFLRGAPVRVGGGLAALLRPR